MQNETGKVEYSAAEMEIVAFENEDVITASCTCDSYDSIEDPV